MKFFVDYLPSSSEKCIFSKEMDVHGKKNRTVTICCISSKPCNLGKESGNCHGLRHISTGNCSYDV